jgi:hypothetical protein
MNPFRYHIAIFLMMLIEIVLFQPLFLFAASSFPNTEVELLNWGVRDLSEIGYLSVGILHKKGKDELIVYDIRKQKPVIPEPPVPLSKIPPFKEGVFLLDDFQGKNINTLGGYFNAFSRSPSESAVSIDRLENGRFALGFSYHQVPTAFSGFRIQLFDFKASPRERIFMDSTPFRYLTFSVRGEDGGEKLFLNISDAFWEKREDSLEIGEVSAFLSMGRITSSWQRAWVPLDRLPQTIRSDKLANLVFLAGSGKGKIYIGDLAFCSEKEIRIPESKKIESVKSSMRRGIWYWHTAKLLDDPEKQHQVVEFCKQHQITDIFLQLPYEFKMNGNRPDILWAPWKLRPLLSLFHHANIRISALDGAPEFALNEHHQRVLAVLKSLILYNRSANPAERFDGIRYDIEPYLLPAFSGIHKKSIIIQYLDLLRKIREIVSPEKIEFGLDIPFWFDGKNEFFEPVAEIEGRPLSQWILDIVDNIGIMDYRTEAYGADGVITHAQDELYYASKKGKTVFIGLETFDVPDETLLEFEKKPGLSGIEIHPLGKTRVLLKLIPYETGLMRGETASLTQTKKTFVPGTKLSFARKSFRELEETMKKAESQFHEFPSFIGFAIHYYESYHALFSKSDSN